MEQKIFCVNTFYKTVSFKIVSSSGGGRVFKDNIYQDNSGTIAALMAAITEKIQEITQEEYVI